MPAMTTEAQEQKQVIISPRMQQIIEHMLGNPKARYHVSGICRDLDLLTGTVTPLMRKMHEAGWVTRDVEPRGTSHPKTWYRFTAGTAPMLRKALRD
jgi:DNA-binding MarR family transcriptional regulator